MPATFFKFLASLKLAKRRKLAGKKLYFSILGVHQEKEIQGHKNLLPEVFTLPVLFPIIL